MTLPKFGFYYAALYLFLALREPPFEILRAAKWINPSVLTPRSHAHSNCASWFSLYGSCSHRLNPLRKKGEPFLIYHSAAHFGHHDTGVKTLQAVNQDGFFRLSGMNGI